MNVNNQRQTVIRFIWFSYLPWHPIKIQFPHWLNIHQTEASSLYTLCKAMFLGTHPREDPYTKDGNVVYILFHHKTCYQIKKMGLAFFFSSLLEHARELCIIIVRRVVLVLLRSQQIKYEAWNTIFIFTAWH